MNRICSDMSASGLMAAFDAVGGFIEKHTQALCPGCESVCCIDRHGAYEPEDLKILESLGLKPHGRPPKAVDTEPCRFLSETGCALPRWRRPFRCTWYFCPALLDKMPAVNPKEYRRFVESLNRLVSIRKSILEKC